LRKTPKIMIFFEPLNEADREILLGIVRYARFRGMWSLCIEPSFNCRPKNRSFIRDRLKKCDIDAIVAKIYNKEELDYLIPHELPIIINAVSEIIPGKPNIVNDPSAVIKLAVSHLRERGFRHFAFCGYHDYFSEEYAKAFSSMISEAGFTSYIYSPPKLRLTPLWENEQAIMAEWLCSLPKPVAIMTINDYRGQEVIETSMQSGLHIPNDIAVIGKGNNEFICENSNPPLSSVAFNYTKAGFEAAETLDKLLSGQLLLHHNVYIQPTHVVKRRSTEVLAVKDPGIAAALNFIHQHARELIRVSDVAEFVGMSRRVLERGFRKELGCSVLHTIKYSHVDLFAQMLIDTDMSITQIALALGHSGTENIARYFHQAKGMSPLEYRRRYSNEMSAEINHQARKPGNGGA
jgi:LacI family transcriptional regulator